MTARRPDPAPLETDDVRTVTICTVLWAVALVALLPFWSRLHRDGHLWWLLACVVGILLGLAGRYYCQRRAAAIARDRAGAAAGAVAAGTTGSESDSL